MTLDLCSSGRCRHIPGSGALGERPQKCLNGLDDLLVSVVRHHGRSRKIVAKYVSGRHALGWSAPTGSTGSKRPSTASKWSEPPPLKSPAHMPGTSAGESRSARRGRACRRLFKSAHLLFRSSPLSVLVHRKRETRSSLWPHLTII